MKALAYLMVALVASIVMNPNSYASDEVRMEERTSIEQIGEECSATCEMMKIKLAKATAEASAYFLVNGADVAVRYQYSDASMVIIADDRKEAEIARRLTTEVREIMLANSVVMGRWIIHTRDGSQREASTQVIARVGKTLLTAYASGSFIGYGDKMANKMQYCYFNWEGGFLQTKYSSYHECVAAE